jgi:hypothetical protein
MWFVSNEWPRLLAIFFILDDHAGLRSSACISSIRWVYCYSSENTTSAWRCYIRWTFWDETLHQTTLFSQNWNALLAVKMPDGLHIHCEFSYFGGNMYVFTNQAMGISTLNIPSSDQIANPNIIP